MSARNSPALLYSRNRMMLEQEVSEINSCWFLEDQPPTGCADERSVSNMHRMTGFVRSWRAALGGPRFRIHCGLAASQFAFFMSISRGRMDPPFPVISSTKGHSPNYRLILVSSCEDFPGTHVRPRLIIGYRQTSNKSSAGSNIEWCLYLRAKSASASINGVES